MAIRVSSTSFAVTRALGTIESASFRFHHCGSSRQFSGIRRNWLLRNTEAEISAIQYSSYSVRRTSRTRRDFVVLAEGVSRVA